LLQSFIKNAVLQQELLNAERAHFLPSPRAAGLRFAQDSG
jgi:hypothetical protein